MDMPTEWRMWIYPNGHKDDCKGYVTTFVEKTTATESVIETNLVFTLVDKHGSKVNNTSKSAKHIFEKKDNLGRGYGKFKSHEELLNLANVLPYDTITIMCGPEVHQGKWGEHRRSRGMQGKALSRSNVGHYQCYGKKVKRETMHM